MAINETLALLLDAFANQNKEDRHFGRKFPHSKKDSHDYRF